MSSEQPTTSSPDRELAASERIYHQYVVAMILYGQTATESVDLYPTDLHGISVLDKFGSVTAGQMAEITGLTTGAATRLIDRLEEAGFARRTVERSDRRKVIVEAVPERIRDTEKLFEPAAARLGEIFGSYTPDELRVLLDYFQRATPVLHDAAAELRGSAQQRRRTPRRSATGRGSAETG